MPARPMPCTRTSTSSRPITSKYIVILAGDHIYKMDYELMLQEHVDTGADVTVGVSRSAAHGSHGLWRDACR